jgi:hypothetical protein
MAPEKLSKKEDRALHRALESVFLTRFPNPERTDCPGSVTLLAIAHKTLPMRDPANEHVTRCSPCFGELQKIRSKIRHTRVFGSMATVTASIIVAVLLGYIAFRTPAGDSSLPPPIQASSQAALLDLRKFSVVRSPSPSSTPSLDSLQLNRSPLELMIQLPIGAEEGPYELQIVGKDDQSPLASAKGDARIENQITTLRTQIDTSRIPPAEYRLALRHADFSWRYYPLAIR